MALTQKFLEKLKSEGFKKGIIYATMGYELTDNPYAKSTNPLHSIRRKAWVRGFKSIAKKSKLT